MVVLNADDPLVAAVARRVRARVGYFSMDPGRRRSLARHRRAGGRAWVLRDDVLVEWDGHRRARAARRRRRCPIALGGLATPQRRERARGGRRGAGAGRDPRAGRRTGCATSGRRRSCRPGRLNLFRLGQRTVIVDFAHNEAGTTAILDVAAAIAGGAAGRAAPVTAIIGTAGDRPDDTLRGIGRIAARKADRIAIKETLGYLRGREREEVVRVLPRGRRRGRRRPRGGARSTRARPRPSSRSWRAPAARPQRHRAGRTRRGSWCCSATRSATRCSSCSSASGARPIDVATELADARPAAARTAAAASS